MNIEVYSKPGCGKCQAAKEKIRLMKLSYVEKDIERYTTIHEGWRHDGTVDVLTAHEEMNTIPLIRIDDDFYDYSGAIRVLKSQDQARAIAPAAEAAAPLMA